jgi:cell division protein FtsB
LLANYSGHISVSRGLEDDPEHLMQTVVESSLSISTLRAQVSNLMSPNATLTADSKRLEAEMEKMEDEHREERRRILQSSGSYE